MPRKQGVRCRNCLSVLRVRSTRLLMYLAPPLLATLAPPAIFSRFGEFVALSLLFFLYALIGTVLVLSRRYPTLFRRLQIPTAGREVKDDDELWEVAEEDDDDELSYTEEELAQWEHDVEQRNGVPWTCSRCNETNPVEFFFCWSCGAPSKAGE